MQGHVDVDVDVEEGPFEWSRRLPADWQSAKRRTRQLGRAISHKAITVNCFLQARLGVGVGVAVAGQVTGKVSGIPTPSSRSEQQSEINEGAEARAAALAIEQSPEASTAGTDEYGGVGWMNSGAQHILHGDEQDLGARGYT